VFSVETRVPPKLNSPQQLTGHPLRPQRMAKDKGMA
jgi:hypothetical protein